MKKFEYDKDGCKSEVDGKSKCSSCIFNYTPKGLEPCPKEKINTEPAHRGMLKYYDYCPECGIKFYREADGTYNCHLHGAFTRDYVTGELVEVK